jgi:hypothetical protein
MKSILTWAVVICLILWVFETDFLILDILFGLLLILGVYILIPLVVLIIVVWVIKELFN